MSYRSFCDFLPPDDWAIPRPLSPPNNPPPIQEDRGSNGGEGSSTDTKGSISPPDSPLLIEDQESSNSGGSTIDTPNIREEAIIPSTEIQGSNRGDSTTRTLNIFEDNNRALTLNQEFNSPLTPIQEPNSDGPTTRTRTIPEDTTGGPSNEIQRPNRRSRSPTRRSRDQTIFDELVSVAQTVRNARIELRRHGRGDPLPEIDPIVSLLPLRRPLPERDFMRLEDLRRGPLPEQDFVRLEDLRRENGSGGATSGRSYEDALLEAIHMIRVLRVQVDAALRPRQSTPTSFPPLPSFISLPPTLNSHIHPINEVGSQSLVSVYDLPPDERSCCICRVEFFVSSYGTTAELHAAMKPEDVDEESRELCVPTKLARCGHIVGDRCMRLWVENCEARGVRGECPVCRTRLVF